MDYENWKETFCPIWNRERGNIFSMFLLDAGLDVDAVNKHVTPVPGHLAECVNISLYGEIYWKEMLDEIWKRDGNYFVRFLLDAGLDVNARNKYGTTMLCLAAEFGNLQMAEYLLQEGADSNVANSDGSKPLHIAVKYNRIDIVKFFLKRGVPVDICDRANRTPLHYVAKCDIPTDYEELVHVLLDGGANINAVDIGGKTPLLLAAWRSHEHLVKLFIKLGADLECRDLNQWTVLHFACQMKLSEVVKTLVDGKYDIDLNARTSKGYTPVIIAAYASRENVVKLLVESGADVESKGSGSTTLLHFACGEGWLQVVELLVSKDCDVNAKDSKGRTPVHMAACNSRLSVVQYLLTNCKNVNISDDVGCTLLDYTDSKKWLQVVKRLVTNNGSAKSLEGRWILFLAARKSHLSVVQYLIERVEDVKGCDHNGWTLLHYACKEGWLCLMESLLGKGCDIDSKDFQGITPLLRAARCGYSSIVEYLIERGADVDCSDVGWTVLHYACERGWLEVVRSLTGKVSDVNARTVSDSTALHIAAEKCHLEIIEHLLEADADCGVKDVGGQTAFNRLVQKSDSLEIVILFLRSGGHLQTSKYSSMKNHGWLSILRNTELCSMHLINKFNNVDLHKIYAIPVISGKLPKIKKLKISFQSNVAQDIAECVKKDIQINGYCDALKFKPIVLTRLCVLSLVKHYIG